MATPSTVFVSPHSSFHFLHTRPDRMRSRRSRLERIPAITSFGKLRIVVIFFLGIIIIVLCASLVNSIKYQI